MSDLPRLPNSEHRTLVFGRTGTGKTFGAVGIMLANANFDEQPWIIMDAKGDKLIRDLTRKFRIPYISPHDPVPKEPGLYCLRYSPLDDDEAIENFLRRVWYQENVGLYFDEGYTIPKYSKAMTGIFTQGRALNIPVIMLYQSPVYLSMHAEANADFFMVYQVDKPSQQKKLADIIEPARLSDGVEVNAYSKLAKHHCIWYDVSRGNSHVLASGPSHSEILEKFGARLAARSKTVIGMRAPTHRRVTIR